MPEGEGKGADHTEFWEEALVQFLGNLKALCLREGGNREGVAEGRPQHGHETQPSSVPGEVTSCKCRDNGIRLLAQVFELWEH